MRWVDNSATRQIACKLLWCQNKVVKGSLEVKQIGTAYNLADIGAKPLSKARLHLLLLWGHVQDGHGEFQEQHVEKGKITKVAKYLNRLLMVSGLELAAGESTDMVMIEPNCKIPFYMLVFIIVMGALIFGAMVLWNKFKRLERRVDVLQAYIDQLEADKGKITREESMAQDFMEHIASMEGFGTTTAAAAAPESEENLSGDTVTRWWTCQSSMWSRHHLLWG